MRASSLRRPVTPLEFHTRFTNLPRGVCRLSQQSWLPHSSAGKITSTCSSADMRIRLRKAGLDRVKAECSKEAFDRTLKDILATPRKNSVSGTCVPEQKLGSN